MPSLTIQKGIFGTYTFPQPELTKCGVGEMKESANEADEGESSQTPDGIFWWEALLISEILIRGDADANQMRSTLQLIESRTLPFLTPPVRGE
jgi:hypothetical protein